MKTQTCKYSNFPICRLIQMAGMMLWACVVLGSLPARASNFQMLHRFQSDPSGTYPQAPLFKASDGILYGTAAQGGQSGAGTIFKINQDGSAFAVIKSFTGEDGAYPMASLIEASDGMLYGTANGGGALNAGVLFKINKDGSNYTVLKNFTSTGTDGANPQGSVIEGSDGALYGTTTAGGNGGVLYTVNKDGSNYTVRHGFNLNEFVPLGGLVEGNDGALYGVTRAGGGVGSSGAIFRMTKDGANYSAIKNFNDTGSTPYAGLAKGSDGTLFGTTYYTNGTSGAGVVFKIGPDGNGYTVLHSFGGSDGANPYGSVIIGSDGVLYGTTEGGGSSGKGTVFTVKTGQRQLFLSGNDNQNLAVISGNSLSHLIAWLGMICP